MENITIMDLARSYAASIQEAGIGLGCDDVVNAKLWTSMLMNLWEEVDGLSERLWLAGLTDFENDFSNAVQTRIVAERSKVELAVAQAEWEAADRKFDGGEWSCREQGELASDGDAAYDAAVEQEIADRENDDEALGLRS